MANSPEAREVMINMICDQGADIDQVNDAIKGDGSNISEASYRFVKNACKWFKKYPQLRARHIIKPYTWEEFQEAVRILESGGALPPSLS